MTLEDATRISEQNGAQEFRSAHVGAAIRFTPEQMLAAFRQVEAEALEKAAKVCEDLLGFDMDDPGSSCAKAIRALKEGSNAG